MRAPSTPQINKTNSAKWFIYWNHDVPHQLWEKYKRKRIRIKIYDNINTYTGKEREEYADDRLAIWKYNVTKNGYNPFIEELQEMVNISSEIVQVKKDISIEEEKADNGINILVGLQMFLESRKLRTDNTNTISTWNGVVDWFTEWLKLNELTKLQISEVKRKHVADALLFNKAKVDKDGKPIWSNRTYNNNLSNISSVFNYFVKEEMIPSNPFKGKIDKLKTKTNKNEWYSREIASTLIPEIKNQNPQLYYACAFTYFLAVRSQQELMKLKVSDIDFSLKRLRFRSEVSKNDKEEYREWPEKFDVILLEMKIQKYPGDFYIFGKNGTPGPTPLSKNVLANHYRPIKEKFNLPFKYTIYSFKHTRVVHEMMKGTDPYEIQYLCRHSSLEETQHYMRGFDLTLRHVYKPEDLTF